MAQGEGWKTRDVSKDDIGSSSPRRLRGQEGICETADSRLSIIPPATGEKSTGDAKHQWPSINRRCFFRSACPVDLLPG